MKRKPKTMASSAASTIDHRLAHHFQAMALWSFRRELYETVPSTMLVEMYSSNHGITFSCVGSVLVKKKSP